MRCPCVYAIYCPINHVPVYVGQSHTPEIRFKSHFYNNKTAVGIWIQSMLEQGKEPYFKKLKLFRYKKDETGKLLMCNMTQELCAYESKMIRKLLKQGYKLFNKQIS